MTERKLRVVLDLNVLISAYFFSKPDSPPRYVLQAALDEYILILHSQEYRADLVEVFSKEKFIDRLKQIGQTPQSIVDIISDLSEDIPPYFIPSDVVRDEDDKVILACAVGGNADYIVSGDQDLTTLDIYQGIPIVTPTEFLLILNPPEE